MDSLIAFSTWVENNAGQIQIGIGLFALILAILGYLKILKQIDISNTQTDSSIAQTKLTIKQIVQLNHERQFELRFNLKKEIIFHISEFEILKKRYENQGTRVSEIEGNLEGNIHFEREIKFLNEIKDIIYKNQAKLFIHIELLNHVFSSLINGDQSNTNQNDLSSLFLMETKFEDMLERQKEGAQ